MDKTDDYRRTLRTLTDWDDYLITHSGLPGPRGNLELVQAAADVGNEVLFNHLLAATPIQAPADSSQIFLAVCGVVGFGRLLAEGRIDLVPALRAYASDSRWRIREGVAMALQRWGERDMNALITTMTEWARGNRLEQRAAAAALCEPRLLGDRDHVKRVLKILDGITASMTEATDRKSEDYKVLRKSMGYCWSVAAAASPDEGKRWMEKWLASADRDVRWMMRENLKKDRLARMDPQWVERWRTGL